MGSILFWVYVLCIRELLLGGDKVKNPKVLKLRHKKFLGRQGVDPEDYLIVKEEADSYTFYNKHTGKLVCVRR